MRLMQLDGAMRIKDLRLPPSNRLEPLFHDRAGQWSIRINDQWRVCFALTTAMLTTLKLSITIEEK